MNDLSDPIVITAGGYVLLLVGIAYTAARRRTRR